MTDNARFIKSMKNHWQLYILILPCVLYFIIFNYYPLYGIQIAFRDFKASQGIWGSNWVGFSNFIKFFHSFNFKSLLSNTFLLNLYGLIAGFPIPIVLSLSLNQIRKKAFKTFTQTSIYAPHFISMVVMAGMLYLFLSPSNGFVNALITSLGAKKIDFMSDPAWFRSVYIISGIWQDAGWGTILYIAALTGIDPEMYEAAEMDGASILQKIRHIDIPGIAPVITMVFILSCGWMLSSNTAKTLLLQTPGNTQISNIIGVYVYNIGIGGGQYSLTSAIGLFINVINFVIIYITNFLSKKVSSTSLF